MGKTTSDFSLFIFKGGIEEKCGYSEENHNDILNYRTIFQTLFLCGDEHRKFQNA